MLSSIVLLFIFLYKTHDLGGPLGMPFGALLSEIYPTRKTRQKQMFEKEAKNKVQNILKDLKHFLLHSVFLIFMHSVFILLSFI